MKIIKIILVYSFLFTYIFSFNCFAQSNILKEAVKKEMNRTVSELKNEKYPVYFLSYYITETMNNQYLSSFGKINYTYPRTSNLKKTRSVDIDLRVGDYKFDNSHIIRGEYNPFGNLSVFSFLPIEDDEKAIRSVLWDKTDRAYKSAIEAYEKAISNQAVKIAVEDTSDDFSKELPNKYYEGFRRLVYSKNEALGVENAFIVDTLHWINVINRLSSKFKKYSWIYSGDVSFVANLTNKYYISTENSELSFSAPYVRLMISIKTKAEDGSSLPLYKDYFSYSCEGLPDEKLMESDIDSMIVLLNELRNANEAETFTGPAILSGEAAGVFFHEIFGHRVEGHREKDPAYSHTFKKSLDKSILPEFMNIVFDPSKKEIDGKEIAGYYKYDDEGQLGQRVEVVKNGIFKSYLMSRSPIEKFPKSNGHGRRSAGRSAVARQSNLIVESNNMKSNQELRNLLIAEAKKQNKDYGLLFDKVIGGYTMLNRTTINSFNVTPIVVYKIYVDGRPDELVRGVDLIGTPLTTFSNILATGDKYGIFNGMCGAESGWVSVSAVSPSLLVSTIEVQSKSKSQTKLPILPSPINTQEGM
ncbi:MAG: TldD/PmbA family protein [Bacteroidetes bacterium]|nr:TldD/PmbA family protein [Bacteroidota bacterium]